MSGSATTLPEFEKPPVIEVAVSIQFKEIARISAPQAAYIGLLVLSLPGRLRPKTVFSDRCQRGQNAVPDFLDRLKTALADRYANDCTNLCASR